MITTPPWDPVILDLELRRRGAGARRLYALGALRPARGAQLSWEEGRGPVAQGLEELDAFCRGATAVVAHNGRRHDLAFLREVAPRLDLIRAPLIDTLELSPLAFPRNPYHRLIKGYKLLRASSNDPLADARVCLTLLEDEREALAGLDADLLGLYRALLSPTDPAYDPLFAALGAPQAALAPDLLIDHLVHPRGSAPDQQEAQAQVCITRLPARIAPLLEDADGQRALAYLLAWLTTAREGRSVIPAWVRRAHPSLPEAVRRLRDVPCEDPACRWCRGTHDLEANLKRFFSYGAFRQDLHSPSGSLQRDLVADLSQGRSVLGILPTGGGKSLCYQLPALMWADRIKALTVVISPLQSLMKDQADSLVDRGIPNAAALYGGLPPPQRKRVLDGVALGDFDLLFVSPEQLRNRSFRSLVEQRQIAAWIIDEAHCLSKWGHDFRPDYRYIGRFIRELCEHLRAPVPPIGCYTATARREVVDDICDHFRDELGVELTRHIGSSSRDNLSFLVVEAHPDTKLDRCVELLSAHLTDLGQGSAVIYASTRAGTELLAQALTEQGYHAESYHAGKAELRADIQERFIRGEVRIIVATNAFGMGVDKGDVRLVVHVDIPGSLESYLQEAGRAGRDGEDAVCVLLYHPADVDTQFRLQAMNRLTIKDVQAILQGLRSRSKRLRSPEVVVTAGEILREPHDATDLSGGGPQVDTKVRAAILVLEQAALVRRNENQYQVFQGSLKVRSRDAIEQKLRAANLGEPTLAAALAVVDVLLNSSSSTVHSTDVLADQTGLHTDRIIETFATLREAGITDHSLQLTAQIQVGVASSSADRLGRVAALEQALLKILAESPDLPADAGPGGSPLELRLRLLTDRIRRSAAQLDVSPIEVQRLIFSLKDARAWSLRSRGDQTFAAELRATLPEIDDRARGRRADAHVILAVLIARAEGQRGHVKVSFTFEQLEAALESDLTTRDRGSHELRIRAALLFLHELRVIVVQGGLAVLRPAMAIEVSPDHRRRFKTSDFQPLEALYDAQVSQIHVMDEYARMGMAAPGEALEFVAHYFEMDEAAFLRRYFNDRREELSRPLRADAFAHIVDELGDPAQQAIVTSDAPALAILAGPGSGKTRVVVHRVAYLTMVQRVPARRILVLSFNRSVSREIRQRLSALIGEEARWVSVHTYHGLALRILGRDLNDPDEQSRIKADDHGDRRRLFDALLEDAAQLLETPHSGEEDGSEWHQDVLAGWRYIFVDEYQDVTQAQYRLIRALTGMHLDDPDVRMTIMAVGDDDQSIYAFAGARVEYIRRFQADYQAEVRHLVSNHRSTPELVAAAGALISPGRDRMKAGLQLRSTRLSGGAPMRILSAPGEVEAARLAVELAAAGSPEGGRWDQLAVLARHHGQLAGIELLLNRAGIPCHRRAGPRLPFHRLRQVRRILDALGLERGRLYAPFQLRALVEDSFGGAPLDDIGLELARLVDDWSAELGDARASAASFIERIYDRSAEPLHRPSERGKVLLSTLHAAKGLEFNAVIILAEPAHSRRDRAVDPEEERRLLYVGVTRARDQLWLIDRRDRPSPFTQELVKQEGSPWLAIAEPPITPQEGDEDVRSLEVVELGLRDLWISYPARGAAGRMGEIIAALRPGDPLDLEARSGSVLIRAGRIPVGALSRERAAGWLDEGGSWRVDVDRAEVAQVCVMDRRDDGDEPVARWELVVPRIWIRRRRGATRA